MRGKLFETYAKRLVDDAVEMGKLLAEHSSGAINGTLRFRCHPPLASVPSTATSTVA